MSYFSTSRAHIARDVRFALRGFRRTPSFAIAVLLVLALGIGMSVAMFATFRAVMVRGLPVVEQDRIAVLWPYRVPGVELAPPAIDLRTVRRASRTMRDIAGVAHWGLAAVPFLDGDRSLTLDQIPVTANYFDVLGARPAIGRFMRPSDGDPGAPRVIVLSYGAWQTKFGGRPSIVGQQLLTSQNHSPMTVIGVAPAGLDYPVGAEAWLSISNSEAVARLIAVARLRPNASLSAARDEFFSIVRTTEPGYKLTGAFAETFTNAVLGDARPVLAALTLAVALLLLIACVNVGNLFLVRSFSRTRELAVRRALGASYGDLVRQLVVESALLSAAGGALGMACASLLIRALVAFAPSQLPRLDEIRVHPSLLGVTIGVTTAVVFLVGLLPAIAASRVDLQVPLRSDSRSGAGTRRGRSARDLLVTCQVALALVMLAAAGLLARSLAQLDRLPLGYQPEHVSILSATFDQARYDSLPRMAAFGDAIARRLASVPGVSAVTTVDTPPFGGPTTDVLLFQAEGQSAEQASANPAIPEEEALPDYFRTFGLPIIRGRGIRDGDRQHTEPIVVISESVARQFFPDQDPIGKRIKLAQAAAPSLAPTDERFAWRTVVGIVGDTRFRTFRQASPTVYFPWRQVPAAPNFWAIRWSGNVNGMAQSIREALKDVDPSIAVFGFQSMDQLLDVPLAEPRLSALLLSAFGVVSLLLAAVGLYGAMSSTVRERTREIGIRVALGASPAAVRTSMLRQAFRVVGVGACVGVATSLMATRVLRSQLFQVSPTDPATLVGACLALLVVAGIAAYVPARRATRIDPSQALRSD